MRKNLTLFAKAIVLYVDYNFVIWKTVFIHWLFRHFDIYPKNAP